jgi:hypothetical protein
MYAYIREEMQFFPPHSLTNFGFRAMCEAETCFRAAFTRDYILFCSSMCEHTVSAAEGPLLLLEEVAYTLEIWD